MLLQVMQAGWLYEIEAPEGSRVVDQVEGGLKLIVPEAPDPGAGVALTPREVIRAAKDHVLGLSCLRAPLGPDEIQPSPAGVSHGFGAR